MAFESLNKELIFLLLQYLNDKEFKESAHDLERESGIFFNMNHCEELVLGGKWNEVEAYLSGFTTVDANRYSTRIFFDIRKQKYLEALDRHDHASAVSILKNDLKVFEPMIEDVFQEMTNLLTLNDIRQYGQLSQYRDANETRKLLAKDVNKLIKANPDFNGKLQFPASGEDRLQILVEQSLNFQHSLCQNPMQNPDPSRISLFTDHECEGTTHGAFLPVAASHRSYASHRSIGPAPNVEGSTNPTVANNGNGGTRNMDVGTSRLPEEDNTKKLWEPTEINEPALFRSLRLPNLVKTEKISSLIYSNSGTFILALTSNALHQFWRWSETELNSSGKVTTKDFPSFSQRPTPGLVIVNDESEAKVKEVMPSMALSKNDYYLISASRGTVSLYTNMIFKKMKTLMNKPPTATCLALNPHDNNVIAIGMDDFTVVIYNFSTNEVLRKLEGHSKMITGLAFSNELNLLVSSGADAQMIVWNSNIWEEKRSIIWPFTNRRKAVEKPTQVQFHHDNIHFLAVHETQLAIFEVTRLLCKKQWPVVGVDTAPISHAALSCDGKLVYACFLNARVCILAAADLQPQCWINPSAYLPVEASLRAYPLVVTTNPQDPMQFAMGLTDGSVYVFEPLESSSKWGDSST